MKDIPDIIKHAKFGDDRLRSSGVVAGQISAFPIDFAGRPYNTLTLPCERVMMAWHGLLSHSCILQEQLNGSRRGLAQYLREMSNTVPLVVIVTVEKCRLCLILSTPAIGPGLPVAWKR